MAKIITIDGPAGTGKSTIAKILAGDLGYTYFNTGAMFRSLTKAFYDLGYLNEETYPVEKISQFLKSVKFEIKRGDAEVRYFVNGEDMTPYLNSKEVSPYVSPIATLPCVRESLCQIQREFAKDTDSIFEGRDMGSIVFPGADLKVFLTASVEVRAKRRYDELRKLSSGSQNSLELDEIQEQIALRDYTDSHREHSPLVQAVDAFEIDTTNLTVVQVVEEIKKYL